jgi:hypothetical protein
MTNSQKYEALWAKFCNLSDKASHILSQYGSLHNCPAEKIREFMFLGNQQTFVQQEISKLFEANNGRISN